MIPMTAFSSWCLGGENQGGERVNESGEGTRGGPSTNVREGKGN